MFERFTDRARDAVVHAQDEARELRHNYLGTEHLLLGLLREEGGLAHSVLESFGVTLEHVRTRVVGELGRGDELVPGQIPFTPQAKKVLDLASREALSLSHDRVDTEHILLGLGREGEGLASRILLDLGIDAEKAREEIVRVLSKQSRPREPAGPARSPDAASGQSRGIVGLAVAFLLGVLTGRARKAH